MADPSSIWEHVERHVPPEGPGLGAGGYRLPDHDEVPRASAWLPGEADGVRLLTRQVQHDDATAAEVGELLRTVGASRKGRGYDQLYERVRRSDVLSYLEGLLELVPTLSVPPDRLYEIGRRLVTTARQREPVKLGIGLFGFFEAGHHVDVLLTLGRHDEFTLYVVGAVTRGLDEPEPLVWQLARDATGWGRIHAVRELARRHPSAEVRDWMLRAGFRTEAGDGYLARVVATSTALADALAAPSADDEVIDAAVAIIAALLQPGAFDDMDGYRDGPRATLLLVAHLRKRASTIEHLLAVRDIERFVASVGNDDARAMRGWTRQIRDALQTTCAEIMSWPSWREKVAAELQSAVDAPFRRAAEAASLIGVDAGPALLRRLRSDPLDCACWLHLMERLDGATVDQAVALAVERIPLDDIATGPGGVLGAGPRYAPHACLDVVLSGLTRWPGRGWRLVDAGLASPVVRNRNLALRVLHAWGRTAWPPEAEPALRRAITMEPEGEVRRRISRLLAGEPVEQPLAPKAR